MLNSIIFSNYRMGAKGFILVQEVTNLSWRTYKMSRSRSRKSFSDSKQGKVLV